MSLDGVVPFAPSYDTVGWFARDAELLAACRRGTAAADNILFRSRNSSSRYDAFAIVDRPARAGAGSKKRELGVSDSRPVFEGDEALCFDCYRILQGAEIWQSLGPWITRHPPRFAADIAERFAGAARVTTDEVAHFAPVRVAIRARFEALMPPDTALVIPTTPCLALLRDAPGDVDRRLLRRALTLTSIAGHCGAPQVALPLGFWRGCPVGVSILGARGSDRALLALMTTLAGSAVRTVSR